jgi:ribosomal protein S25
LIWRRKSQHSADTQFKKKKKRKKEIKRLAYSVENETWNQFTSKEVNKKMFCEKYVLFFSKMQSEKYKSMHCFTKASISQTLL